MVHDRVFIMSRTLDCPLCGKREMVQHALSTYKFYPVTYGFLHKSLVVTRALESVDGPEDGSVGPVIVQELACQGLEPHTLRESQGYFLWVAREAHWALRWCAKNVGRTTL